MRRFSAPGRPSVAPELHRLGLALVLAVLLITQVWLERTVFGRASLPLPVLLALALATCLPLLTVGRWPVRSLAVMFAAAAAYRSTGAAEALTWVGPVVAVYTATLNEGRRLGLIAAVAAAVALSMPVGSELTPLGTMINVLRTLALTGAAAAFGEANRSRRERAVEAELRAEEAERARASEAARAVDEERLRIARELHDVTAHSLSVIAIQSELARRTMAADRVAADAALEAIGTTSREALGELRAMLAGLRGDEDPSAPTPSLARIGELVDQLESSGVAVRLSMSDSAADVPPFVGATAYRIVQEAVTNVIRHAGATTVTIKVERSSSELVIAVTDDGRKTGVSPSPGHGIIGMRERAAALGGSLESGPLLTGGWRVSARIPVPHDTGEV